MDEITTSKYRTPAVKDFDDDCLTVVLNGLRSERSKNIYATNARLFNVWLSAQSRSINIDSVIAYIAALESEGKKPATINSRLATIRAIVKVAKRKRLIDAHEADGIIEIKSRKPDSKENANWLEKSEIEEIFRQLRSRGTNKDKRDAALLALGVATGLRRNELLSLSWGQVEKRGRKTFLTNVKTKGSKERKVIVQKWALKYLNAWGRVTGKTGSLFIGFMSRRGDRYTQKPINAVALSKIVKRLGKMVEIEGLAPHDLRRTHAAMMYDAGKSVRDIQASLGHASVVTTERYLKPIQADRNADDEAFTI